jgi:hypothetical protein
MNKEQIEKQYLLWNRGQRPTSLTTDFLSEAVDPINWIPTARAGAGLDAWIILFYTFINIYIALFSFSTFKLDYCFCSKYTKMMTFITEVKNIVNDTSIPRPIRNKLFNDMQSDIGLEINPQQIFELAMKGRNIIFN